MTTDRPTTRFARFARPVALACTLLALACAAWTAPVAAKEKKLKAKDMLLERGWPDVTEEQRALTDVDFAKGAPAVRLLRYREHNWDENLQYLRTRLFTRTKILTEDGIESYGSHRIYIYGNLRVQKLEARTILPDGTVVPVEDGIHEGLSDDGSRVIDVAWPQVRVGAILDFEAQLYADGVRGVQPWELQERIPVLEARLVLQPPAGLRFRNAVMNMPPEKASPDLSFNVAGGLKAHAWYAENVPPFPDLAYLPPLPDISPRLFIIIEQYKNDFVFIPIAKDWKSWNERVSDYWDDWFKLKHEAVDALARQATEGISDPVEKAEAIRVALRDRFRVNIHDFYYPPDDMSPDAVLAEGSGSSTRMAGLATLMLRASGVDAVPVGVRRRSDGILPIEFPMETMLDDMIVLYADGKYFAPAADTHAGRLPFDYSGIVAMPLDGTTEQPLPIPDFKAAQNRSERNVEAKLATDGTLSGTARITHTGVAAAEWRRLLGSRSEEQRREYVRDRMRRHMPGLELESLELEEFDDPTKELTIVAGFEVPGYASVAGKRLIFNPNLFSRMDPSDWAPEERAIQIDLESAFEYDDSLTVTLPDGVTDIRVPDAVEYPAGVVGTYKTVFGKRGDDLVAKRLMRLELFRFPPKVYSELRRWFAGIAAVDEQPVVLTLP